MSQRVAAALESSAYARAEDALACVYDLQEPVRRHAPYGLLFASGGDTGVLFILTVMRIVSYHVAFGCIQPAYGVLHTPCIHVHTKA